MLLAFSLYISRGLAIAQGHQRAILRVNIAIKIESHLREPVNCTLVFLHFSVHSCDIDSTNLSI